MVGVFIAETNFLFKEGLKSLIKETKGVKIIGEASTGKDLTVNIIGMQPDVLIINYSSEEFNVDNIGFVLNFLPHTKILAITPDQPKDKIVQAIDAGIKSHVLWECSKEEVTEAIFATAHDEKFFCGKVVDKLVETDVSAAPVNERSCDPVKISCREVDIIKLIAEGYTNKGIADILFISTHTVMTHRKNIMNKLGVNNTAGIVLYAVKENLISPNKYLFEPSAQ